jgi:phosphopantetheinyl transferase (holo-ACP synthase)
MDPGAVSLGGANGSAHSAIGANGSGKTAAGLDGAHVAPVTVPPVTTAVTDSHPVLVAYQEAMAATIDAGQQVIEAWSRSGLWEPAPGSEALRSDEQWSPQERPARLAMSEPGDEPVGEPRRYPAGEPRREAADEAAGQAAAAGEDPASRVTPWTVSIDAHPELLDHCFYRQPAGWESVEDLFPVVPMTMLLEIMGRAAQELVPGLVVLGFDDVRALRWLAAAPALETVVRARVVGSRPEWAGEEQGEEPGYVAPDEAGSVPGGVRRVQVSIDGYAKTTVVLGRDYPSAPGADRTPLTGERESDISARTMYDDRWMFHGPAYQGVTELTAVAEDGIRGQLADLPAPGALLDCAGQLMGYWAMRRTEIDRLALPTSIKRVRFFGPRPGLAAPVSCTVRITEYTDNLVQSDMDLCIDGGLWARVDGWQDRRFESDAVVWPVLIYPEKNVLTDQRVLSAAASLATKSAASASAGSVGSAIGSATGARAGASAGAGAGAGAGVSVELTRERWTDSASRALMMRRYLGEDERVDYERHTPRAQRTWLLGRIAAKDAVRRWLWARGARPMHPVEVHVTNDEHGRPMASVPPDVSAAHLAGSALSLSISHTEWVGVAVVSDAGPIGVDVERVTPQVPRSDGFLDIALTQAEQALRPDDLGTDQWVALTWTAKEAVAKAAGTGLKGRPRAFEVEALTDAGNQCELTFKVRDPAGRGWTVASSRDADFAIAATIGRPDPIKSVPDPRPTHGGAPPDQHDGKDDHDH